MKSLRAQSWITILALLCIAIPVHTLASPITRQQAQQNAFAFMQERGKSIAVSSLRHAPMRAAYVDEPQPYYVFNVGNNQGYVIASGDDCAYPVLGYADSGSIDVNNMPCNLQAWLDGYARQIKYLQEHGATPSRAPKRTNYPPAIEPMLTCHWNQGYPYNESCPKVGGQRCLTGCVATAMAQVMYYHRDCSTNQTIYEIPSYKTTIGGLSMDAIPAETPIDWDNMIDDYYRETPTEAQVQAVADLMLMCGSSVHMNYGLSSSGAFEAEIAVALQSFFNYKKTQYVSRSPDNDDDWDELIYNELSNSRPVIYGGTDSLNMGHSFVCDGYDGQGFFHINLGWSGYQDGYFLLTTTDEGNVMDFSKNQAVIIHIEPRESLTQPDFSLYLTDPIVRYICIQNWDINDDDILSKSEAKAVTDFIFLSATNWYFILCEYVTSFNEFKYFTGVTTISDGAFSNCHNLKRISFPNSIKRVGNNIFYGCSSLKSITIPNSVNSLSGRLCVGCSNLKSVTIGKSVTDMGKYNFYGCDNLTSLYCLPLNPPNLYSWQFNNDWETNIQKFKSVTLYVPMVAVNAYKSTEPWYYFDNIVGLDPSLGDVNLDDEINIADINVIINSILSDYDDCLNEFMSDVNCDGEVNIADLNTLIDKILGSNH